jgi:hypothetical protein
LHSDTLIYPWILALLPKVWIKNDKLKLQVVYFDHAVMRVFDAMAVFSYYQFEPNWQKIEDK